MNTKLKQNLVLEAKGVKKPPRHSSNKQLTTCESIVPQGKRSNTHLLSPAEKAEFAGMKGEGSEVKAEAGSRGRSNTFNISRNKLPTISSPMHLNEMSEHELTQGTHKFSFPMTGGMSKKLKDLSTSNQNDGSLTVSHNDFRRSMNYPKRPLIKNDKPTVMMKRRVSDNVNKNLINGHNGLTEKKTQKTKLVFNKNSKCQIIARSASCNDSDKENDEKANASAQNSLKPFAFNKSHVVSHAGKAKGGVSKINQDTYLVYENILGLRDYCIYGIMDGHGANGHLVSQFIQSEAQEYFSNEELYYNSKEKTPPSSTTMKKQLIQEKLEVKDYSAIASFYKKTNSVLSNKKFDVHFSGSTCVLVFQIGNRLICSNTGDSRAILIRGSGHPLTEDNSTKSHTIIELSIDHKPECKEERKRIEGLGGEVDQYETKGVKTGPYRVWIKGESYPGLAISRTIGDEIAESIGVICTPEFISVDLSVNDQYIVIASDGVWEFLDNETVMNMINPFYYQNDPEGACNTIVAEALKKWEKEDEVIDDISVIIAFLKNDHFF